MARRDKPQTRGWQFWRVAFWTRPALLVLYGGLFGAVGIGMVATVPGVIRDAVAMHGAVMCPVSAVRTEAEVDPPEGCLEQVPVILSGPQYRRGPGSSWRLLVERNGQQEFYARADVSGVSSDVLPDGARTEAIFWEGTPVAIAYAGEWIPTEAWGHRNWLMQLSIGMFATTGLLIGLEAARLKRRTTNGWWSVRGEEVRLRPSPLLSVARLLGLPSMFTGFVLMVGLTLLSVAVVAVLGLGYAIYALRKPAGRPLRIP